MGHDQDVMDLTREQIFTPSPLKSDEKLPSTIFKNVIEFPVAWFHENVVKRIRPLPYPYYQFKFSRVTDIDQCFTDDVFCIVESDEQFHRDKLVEGQIVKILKRRRTDCVRYYGPSTEDIQKRCKKEFDDYDTAVTNFFVKYGELAPWSFNRMVRGDVRQAFFKQKHRLLWERKYGPVGSTSSSRKAEVMLEKEESMLAKLRSYASPQRIPKEYR